MKSKKAKVVTDKPKDFYKKMGARIRELRIKAGYSSYEYFAFEHGIGFSQYGKYERGADMRMSTIIRILEALNVNF